MALVGLSSDRQAYPTKLQLFYTSNILQVSIFFIEYNQIKKVYQNKYKPNNPPFLFIIINIEYRNKMRDLDNSLGFNYSRFSCSNHNNNWQNFSLDDASQDMSLLNNNPTRTFNINTLNNTFLNSQQPSLHLQNLQSQSPQPNFHFSNLLSEPPQPTANIYNCIESEHSEEHGSIKEVEYIPNEPEAKPVNSKQYYRMMKRRIKKVINHFSKSENVNKLNRNSGQDIDIEELLAESKQKRGKYMYESRHKHATARPRGKDGKFLATRPQSERFRQKKKRGRKPKNNKDKEKELSFDSKNISLTKPQESVVIE